MCWSGPASYTIAAVGIVATVKAIRQGDSALLWSPLVYFTAIEMLQGYSYSVEGQCALPQNQVATLLAYVHIAFQPLFTCILALYFIPSDVRRMIMPVVLGIGALTGAYLLIQIYPFEWAGACRPGRLLCSDHLCVKKESWHIGWHLPLNDLGERLPATIFGRQYDLNFPVYFTVMFILPALFGAWKVAGFQLMVGPTLAWATASSPTEMPAIWCLFSLGIVMTIVFTPLREFLFVKSWPLWDVLRRVNGRYKRTL